MQQKNPSVKTLLSIGEEVLTVGKYPSYHFYKEYCRIFPRLIYHCNIIFRYGIRKIIKNIFINILGYKEKKVMKWE